MDPSGSSADTHITCLPEHAQGTCEVWLRRIEDGDISVMEPIRIIRLSGRDGVYPKAEQVAASIELDHWMAEHLEVFTEGRTSPG